MAFQLKIDTLAEKIKLLDDGIKINSSLLDKIVMEECKMSSAIEKEVIDTKANEYDVKENELRYMLYVYLHNKKKKKFEKTMVKFKTHVAIIMIDAISGRKPLVMTLDDEKHTGDEAVDLYTTLMKRQTEFFEIMASIIF